MELIDQIGFCSSMLSNDGDVAVSGRNMYQLNSAHSSATMDGEKLCSLVD